MMVRLGWLIPVLILTLVPCAAAESLEPEWKGGLRFTSEDGSTQIKAGGRIHQDWAFLTGEDELEAQLGTLEDGVEFRRARLYVAGTVEGLVEFKAQYDFAGGSASFRDMYMGLKKTPLFGAGLRVGHFNQPVGLEILTSSNSILAMERGPTSQFAPGRESGLMLHRKLGDGRGTVAVSTFRTTDSQGEGTGDDGWNTAARVTALPWSDEEGLLHVGASATHRSSPDDVLEMDVETEAHLLPDYGVVEAPADSWVNLGGELAVVKGPFSAQAEVATAHTSAPTGEDDATFMAYYVLVGWFLTGEQLPYKSSSGAFNGAKPKQNYGDGGPGAVQLVARFSHLDLEDGALRGGTLDAVTLGLNWILTPTARVLLNYVRSDGEGVLTDESGPLEVAGVSHAFQSRFQVTF